MIDEFPSYKEPLPGYLVSEEATFSIELRRATFCDEGVLASNGARSDIAPIPRSQGHENSRALSNSYPAPDGEAAALPCFAAVHGSWKEARGLTRDEWWR